MRVVEAFRSVPTETFNSKNEQTDSKKKDALSYCYSYMGSMTAQTLSPKEAARKFGFMAVEDKRWKAGEGVYFLHV